jgi:hypothetical protein
MDTWVIVAIIVAVAFIGWYMMKKKTVPIAPPVVAVPIPAAPGVTPSTGYIPPNAPPPIPEGVAAAPRPMGNLATAVTGLARTPSAVLQQVPIVGGLAKPVVRGSIALANAPLAMAGNILSHVPIVGGLAQNITAAPKKILSSAASFFGF